MWHDGDYGLHLQQQSRENIHALKQSSQLV